MNGTLFFLCVVVGILCWENDLKFFAMSSWLLAALHLFVALAIQFGGQS